MCVWRITLQWQWQTRWSYSILHISFFPLPFFSAEIFMSAQCCGAIPPDVLEELLVIKENREWKWRTDGATDSWDAVITESTQLAGIVLTFQSCTLFTDISYGPISLWDKLEVFSTQVMLSIEHITPTCTNIYVQVLYVCSRELELLKFLSDDPPQAWYYHNVHNLAFQFKYLVGNQTSR